jgi:hypothetical protein
MVKVLIPSVLKQRSVRPDDLHDLRYFRTAEALGTRERDGTQPEFGVTVAALNVDVRRLSAFEAEKEEPVAGKPLNGWHPFLIVALRAGACANV